MRVVCEFLNLPFFSKLDNGMETLTSMIPFLIIIIGLLVLVFVAIISLMYLLSYINFNKRAQNVIRQVAPQGFIELELLRKSFNEVELNRLQNRLGDHVRVAGNLLVTTQFLENHIREIISSKGSVSVEELSNSICLDQRQVEAFLKEMVDIAVSSNLIAYSDQYLHDWLNQKVKSNLQLNITSLTDEILLAPETLFPLIETDRELILSKDLTIIYSSKQLARLFSEELSKTGRIHIQGIMNGYQISLEDLSFMLEGHSDLITKEEAQ